GCLNGVYDVPRVGSGDDVLDGPAELGSLDLAARLLEEFEGFGIADIVPRKKRQDHNPRPMPKGVVLQDEELLLRAEPGRAVVLHRKTHDSFALRRSSRFDGHRESVGEGIAERGDLDVIARRVVAKAFR